MKKLLFVLLLTLPLISGCALKAYYDACRADVECSERANNVGTTTRILTSTGVGLVPHPAAQAAAPIAGKVAGSIALVIALVLGGRTLTKKSQP